MQNLRTALCFNQKLFSLHVTAQIDSEFLHSIDELTPNVYHLQLYILSYDFSVGKLDDFNDEKLGYFDDENPSDFNVEKLPHIKSVHRFAADFRSTQKNKNVTFNAGIGEHLMEFITQNN